MNLFYLIYKNKLTDIIKYKKNKIIKTGINKLMYSTKYCLKYLYGLQYHNL